MPRSVPLERYLRRRRVLPVAVGLAVVLLMVVAGWADRRGWLDSGGRLLAELAGRHWQVVGAAPGPLLQVAPHSGSGPSRWVRLVGLSTRCPASSAGRVEANMARRLLARLQPTPIRLRVVGTEGSPPMVLAWDSAGVQLNELLLVEGWCCVSGEETHRRHARYVLLEQQARHDAVGIWAIDTAEAEASP